MKDKFEKILKVIGWSLEDCGCNHFYVVNHNNVRTNWCLFGDELSYDRPNKYIKDEDECFCVVFNIKDSLFRLIEGKTISICVTEKKAPFVLFMNHEMKRNNEFPEAKKL